MKKWLKIFLIVSIPIMVGILAFGGTILYSYLQVDYFIGETSISYDIAPIIFEGEIELATPAEIKNKGLYSIRDLTIIIEVYGENFSNVDLDDQLLGSGLNELGDVIKGQIWSDDIIVQLDLIFIPSLAVYDGDFKILIKISLSVDFGIFLIPINIKTTEAAHWNAPFSL